MPELKVSRRRLAATFAIGVLLSLLLMPKLTLAETMTFLSPGEGVEISSSKPSIVFASGYQFSEQNLLVQLDGIDITRALVFTPTGFSFQPIQPLANGAHQISLVVYFADGSNAEQVFSFSTLTKVSSNTEISAVYEQLLDKSDNLPQVPQHNFAANLGHTTTFTQGNWQMGLTTNLRWLDRSVAIPPPEKKGVDLVNYLLYGYYQKEDLNLLVSAGDQQIQETQNTVSGLARRGMQTKINYKSLSLNGFVVRSEQLYGLDDGSGLEFDSSNSIKGVSAGYTLLSDTLKLRAIYVTGAEQSNSFGI